MGGYGRLLNLPHSSGELSEEVGSEGRNNQGQPQRVKENGTMMGCQQRGSKSNIKLYSLCLTKNVHLENFGHIISSKK